MGLGAGRGARRLDWPSVAGRDIARDRRVRSLDITLIAVSARDCRSVDRRCRPSGFARDRSAARSP